MRWLSRGGRLFRNLVRDLRHGAFLGGVKKTPHGTRGAYDTANSGYRALEQIFSHPAVTPLVRNRTLVDVGCGKGRVLNFLIDALPGQPILGLEIDEAVARRVARRLKHRGNVTIRAGDVRDLELPDDAIFYLFNPFDADVMRAFATRLVREDRRGSVLIYYNPMHVDIFKADPNFELREIELDADCHPCVLISLRLGNNATGQVSV